MKSFLEESAGSVATLMALLLVPVVMAAGMAVDYSRAVNARSDVQSATDAAALAVLTLTTASDAELERVAKGVVMENLEKANRAASVSVTVRRIGGGDVEVEADIALDANFPRIGGYPALEASARSVATQSGGGGHLDVYLLIDRSTSMFIAQPGPDMTAMLNLTRPMVEGTYKEWGEPDGCAFACHGLHGWEQDGISLYDRARSNGISLRMDTVIEAATELTESLLGGSGSTVRVGVVDFGIEARLGLAPTRDIEAVKTALATQPEFWGLSHYHELFDFLASDIVPPGNGTGIADRRALFVLVTDGVYTQWYEDGTYPPEAVAASSDDKMFYELFDSSLCQPLIERGYEFSVINTIYDPLINSWSYDNYVHPYADRLGDSLKACATMGYAEGSSIDEVKAAFAGVAGSVVTSSPPRIKY